MISTSPLSISGSSLCSAPMPDLSLWTNTFPSYRNQLRPSYLEPLDILIAANAPAVVNPANPTPPAHTPQCRTSFCHLSLLRASAYPTSGLKVTISYKLVHPVTRLVGNGFVRDRAIEADDGRGRILDRKESRCRRR
jgi:hypothetical protein